MVRRLVERLRRDGRELRVCYEAGPCGYGLHRQLTELGCHCVVVAPALIPRRPGDRVKTDRRDATALATLHRAGGLTSVCVPDAPHQAMRDLVRARAAAARALTKTRQQFQAFLNSVIRGSMPAALGPGRIGAGWSTCVSTILPSRSCCRATSAPSRTPRRGSSSPDGSDRGARAGLVHGDGGRRFASHAVGILACSGDLGRRGPRLHPLCQAPSADGPIRA